jgi:hypothetical protein
VEHVRHIRAQHPGDLVVVYIPEYVVRRWWHQILHNQIPLRIKTRLLFERGVLVTSVPFQLGQDRQALKGPVSETPTVDPTPGALEPETLASRV